MEQHTVIHMCKFLITFSHAKYGHTQERMNGTIRILNCEVPVQLFDATVIHADKYAAASGGMFNLPVTSTLYTEVVFRLRDYDRDCRLRIKNLDVPLYTNQDVSVICSRGVIIGFIDTKSNAYYYTLTDFSGELGFGFEWHWFLLTTFFMTAIIFFFQLQQFSRYLLIPLLAGLCLFYLHKSVLNYLIRRSLDKHLR